MKYITSIVLVIALAGVGYALFTQTGANVTLYYDIDQIHPAELTNQRIKLSGVVKEGSVEKGSQLRTAFDVTGGHITAPVVYTGPLPDIFRDGIQVVLTGSFDASGLFTADELLAKCPSKYQAEGNPDDFKHLDGYEIEYDHRKNGLDGNDS